MGDLSENFSVNEFRCKCGCGAYVRSDELVKRLQAVRDKVKMPVVITSGTRCFFHNREVNGADTSAHLTGMAADITSKDNWLLLRACLAVFNRVGIGHDLSFIHVDIDDKKPQRVVWGYDSNRKRVA